MTGERCSRSGGARGPPAPARYRRRGSTPPLNKIGFPAPQSNYSLSSARSPLVLLALPGFRTKPLEPFERAESHGEPQGAAEPRLPRRLYAGSEPSGRQQTLLHTFFCPDHLRSCVRALAGTPAPAALPTRSRIRSCSMWCADGCDLTGTLCPSALRSVLSVRSWHWVAWRCIQPNRYPPQSHPPLARFLCLSSSVRVAP